MFSKIHYFLIFFVSIAFLNAQTKISKWNFYYKYDPEKFATVSNKIRLNPEKDSIEVYLKVNFNAQDRRFKNVVNKDNWYFDYRIATSYEVKSSLQSGYVKAERQFSDKNEFIFKFYIPRPNSSSAYLFIIIFEDDEDTYVEDIPLKVLDKELFSTIIPTDNTGNYPEFDPFILKNDTVKFVSKEDYEIQYYKYSFQPAPPPMVSATNSETEIKLFPDTIFYNKKDSVFIFPKKGNYTIKNSFQKGLNLLVVENKYPKVSRVKELVDPTIYIATDDERKVLRTSSKPKAKLDDFWLDLGQDKEYTRKLIKNYYKRVELANRYFTCHKEGWKTDMGMVYIVFGKPEDVFKSDVKETWYFKKTQNLPALRFVFYKKASPFGDYYYELETNQDYASHWYTQVELWRRGLIE